MSHLVPRYWSEARLHKREGGRRLTLRRWGWSDDSTEAAHTHAQARVEAAMTKALEYGWPNAPVPFDRRERKQAYNGAEGVPVREEIIEERGEDVVTRNGYGARCLNVPDAMFVDVDTADLLATPWWWRFIAAGLSLLIGVLWWQHDMAACDAEARACLDSFHWVFWGIAWRAIAAFAITRVFGVLGQQWWLKKRGGAVEHAVRQANAEGGRWAVYETPAGARLLALHDVFDPRAESTQALMARMGADPLYRRMCKHQRCFRARVSAKPWRMPGIERLRGPLWPIEDPDKQAKRKVWARAYEAAQEGFAACRYHATVGEGAEAARAKEVQAWHDSLSKAQIGLPLA